MTVNELLAQLNSFDGDRPIRFVPARLCPMGYPEWREASVNGEDDGFVLIDLEGLQDD